MTAKAEANKVSVIRAMDSVLFLVKTGYVFMFFIPFLIWFFVEGKIMGASSPLHTSLAN
jgi:hypothetical protein